jgi:DNA repair ATPase RecN
MSKRRDPVPDSAKFYLRNVETHVKESDYAQALFAQREAYNHVVNAFFAEAEELDKLKAELAELRKDRERLAMLLAAVGKHHAQHADDLCYMDDDELYAAAGLPARNPQIGDPKAMLRNCKRFIRQRCFGGGNWKSYAELESELAALREASGEARAK